ncbi:MAG: serine/threonine protein kinase, partial [Polyangiaceae bacterium]|nr:serine/threonine protein kinase [Polyangiaceae bacterium]
MEPLGVVAAAQQGAERVAPPTDGPSAARQDALEASWGGADGPVSSGRVSDVMVGRGLAGGKYVVLSPLGQGAVGAVYKAHHRDLDKVVAVKVLHPSHRRDPEFATRFHGEALAASKLDHGNVVRVLDFGQEPDGLLYLVMEFLAGRELAAVLERDGIPELPRLVSIVAQICAALAIAHEAGVAHRDIKPANVMLIDGQDDEGQPIEIAKVSDFGLAAEIQSANTDERRIICGTPVYMSPEQCQAKVVDGRSDIYSVGMILYEMATGTLPFANCNVHEVLRCQQEETPTPPSEVWPDIDSRLERIILKSIAKAPEDRYQTARELRAELRRLVERRQERREVFDLAKLTPLSHDSAGFAPFFVTFASAILRMGYYERGHAQFGFPIARLAEAVKKTLAHRGELTFVRQQVHGEIVITVVSGAGDAANLDQLVPHAVATLFADKFADALIRRHVVSLTIRDGVEAGELEDLVELLSGPEVDPGKVRERLDQLRLPSIELLFAEEMLGRGRRLPWQVDLCISRVARDLRGLPLLRRADPETMRTLRLQIVGDVLRPLSRPEQLRILLDHADLIASHIESIPELQGLDVTDTVLASLSPRMCVALGRVLLDDVTGKTPSVVGATPRRDPKELLFAVAKHLSRGLVSEGEALLRELHDRAVLRFDQLPREVQIGIKAEETASQIAAQGEAYLQRFDLVQDPKAYNYFAALFERAMRYLVQRARARDVRMTLSHFEKHTSDPVRIPEIRQRAAAAVASLDNAELTTVLSHIYLTGDPDERDDARAVLLKYPQNAAAGLCGARAEFSGKESALRARFVGAMRDLGPSNWPVLGEKIRSIDDNADESWIDDILRSVPNVCDEVAGERVAALAKHPS